ncbi:hypothetical protein TL16_g10922 [Triparma laevis f. inornata]|uniref:Uncharacterized protein n=2 Tax=Triparma laevis TaxID=1534972 RepID=A0A9W7F548_9STRA|nr:hypothetical protein TL16_g10922 [Triparma laevis f. inornata]GMI03865.1 hypothetical protein TrLO_g11407 [Triparma laevis f. longispina]
MVPSQLSNLHMALSSTTEDNLEHLLQDTQGFFPKMTSKKWLLYNHVFGLIKSGRYSEASSGITEFENCLECTFGLDILIYSLNSLSTLNIAGLASNNLFGILATNDYNSINKAVRIYDESYHGLISGFGRGVGLTKQKGFLQMKEEEQIDTKVGPWILTQAGLSLIELTVSGYVEIGDFRWKKLGERMGEVDFEYFREGSVVKRIILEEDLLGQELEGIEHSLFGEEVRNEALN